MADETTRGFEQRLQDLSGIVERLEGGELTLEDAITHFESGRKLHRALLDELEGYEKRIERLVQGADGTDRLEPLQTEDREENDDR